MGTRKFFCEICGKETEHQVDTDDDEGELALCCSCGRVSLPPPEPAAKARGAPCDPEHPCRR